jgi:D-allose transport system substrate-binding protein
MKIRLAVVSTVCALSVSLLAGCGTSTKTSSTTPSKGTTDNGSPKVAFVLKTLSNPYWASMKKGIENEAKKVGVKVDIYAVSSESDTQGQSQLVQDALDKGYQGIAVAPISPVNLNQEITQANQKGVYVVDVDEKVDMNELKQAGGYVYAFVATDNVKAGSMAAKTIVNKLGSAGGQVAIIEGQAGADSGNQRKEGATQVFQSTPGIKLVASQPADWDRSKALNVATNILQRYPDLKAFYAANDTMALGAMQAVENAGKAGKVIVVGTDGDPEAIKDVKAGQMYATVAQDSEKIGAESLDKLLAVIKQKTKGSPNMTPENIAVSANLVTK